MAFTVVYDACVLFPNYLRDLLIRLAINGKFRARWTEQILDECFRSILAKRPDLREAQLERTRDFMNRAIPDVLVENYESLIDGLTLPEPNDRHVLAAAIRAGAQVIVTWNLRDFPQAALTPYDIEAQSPDEFVLQLLDLNPVAVRQAVQEQAKVLRKPPMTFLELTEVLGNNGLTRSAEYLNSMGEGE